MRLEDTRESLAASEVAVEPDVASAITGIEQALALLAATPHAQGVSIPDAADDLDVSRRTIENWIARGALEVVPGTKPRQVDISSLRRVRDALDHLRSRQDEAPLVNHVEALLERAALDRNASFRRGLAEFEGGDFSPA